MTIFSGYKGYKYMRDEKIPPQFFRAWLKEKWKADLKMLFVFITLSPLLVLWLFGAALTFIGATILGTKGFFPDSLFLENNYRAKQFAAADAARIFVTVRNSMDKKDPAV
jgi:hypothetical protein